MISWSLGRPLSSSPVWRSSTCLNRLEVFNLLLEVFNLLREVLNLLLGVSNLLLEDFNLLQLPGVFHLLLEVFNLHLLQLSGGL